MGLTEAKDLARAIVLIERNTPEARRRMAFYIHQRYGGPLTGAERQRRYRDKTGDEAVTPIVTPPVTKASPPRDETRDGIVTPRVTKPVTGSSHTPGSSSFLKFYSEQFERAFNDTPSINYAKDGAISKRLLKQYGEEKLRGLLEDFFKSDDEFIQKSGHTLGVFASVLNKLLVAKRNGHHGQPRSFSERLWDEAQAEKRGQP